MSTCKHDTSVVLRAPFINFRKASSSKVRDLDAFFEILSGIPDKTYFEVNRAVLMTSLGMGGSVRQKVGDETHARRARTSTEKTVKPS